MYIYNPYERVIKQGQYPLGISDAEFRKYIIDYLLPDWQVADPMGQTQVNELALMKILTKYHKKFQ